MAVRAITFDFWSTLFRDANSVPRQQVRVSAFANATGVPEPKIAEALRTVWVEFARSHRENQKTLGPHDAVRLTAERLGVVIEPDVERELADVFGTAILLYPPVLIEDAPEAIRVAAKFGPVALISDSGVSPGSSLRQLLTWQGLSELFFALVFSDEVGVSKPHALMFETAARLIGTEPDELLHIGDLEDTDVAGAKGVNARAALFLHGGIAPEHASQADYVIGSWREFLEKLPDMTSPSQ